MDNTSNVEVLPAIREKFNTSSLAVKGLGALIILGGAGICVPILINTLMAGMTVLGIGLVILTAAGLSKSVGYFGQVLDNRILGLRKKEARDNPIEQMQNELVSNQQIFDLKKLALKEFAAEIKNMEDDLKKSKEEFPGEDWSNDEATIVEATSRYHEKQSELGEAEGALHAFAGQIRVMDRRLQMAKSSEKLNAKTRSSKEEVVGQILVDEAISSVRNRLNAAMSAIQVEAGLRKSRQERIENGKMKK